MLPRPLPLEARVGWEENGRPDPYEYGITITPEKQFAWLADPDDGPRWPLHEAAAATSR
ncbi:hypothetical protein AB0I39_35670 [Kitasatospora purpeofusca]|uniref:hypothetical protein n=1 Tax=Kitasatospora purpeofusca TaxID=67352 RepID=UPI00340D58A1